MHKSTIHIRDIKAFMIPRLRFQFDAAIKNLLRTSQLIIVFAFELTSCSKFKSRFKMILIGLYHCINVLVNLYYINLNFSMQLSLLETVSISLTSCY